MPRSLVNFNVDDGVLSAKPLNDTAELFISIVLPVQFAYRFLTFTWDLIQDVAFNWQNGYMTVTNGIRGIAQGTSHRWHITNPSVDHIVTPVSEMKILHWSDHGPTDILQSIVAGSSPVIVFKVNNVAAEAGAAGTTSFLATFLEYDIEQAQRFPIHWPTMTYGRNP